jgi:hypothetical protein
MFYNIFNYLLPVPICSMAKKLASRDRIRNSELRISRSGSKFRGITDPQIRIRKKYPQEVRSADQ